MIDNVLISEFDLSLYTNDQSPEARLKALLNQQKEKWPLCSIGYENLEGVQIKIFEFDGFVVKVQFNPHRIVSSSAKVDDKSISERQCFLCHNNLPKQQKAILFRNDYLILCNPFPIFNEHYTIPNIEHIPQLISNSFLPLLEISKKIGKNYITFYNGPKCGASAPDHLHFQAGNKNFLPIDSEYKEIKVTLGEVIIDRSDLQVYAVNNNYHRRFFSFESADSKILLKAFESFYNTYSKISVNGDEPMMNILCSYDSKKWRVIIFPRIKHRPSYFFAEGSENILISPAAVDFGGVLITPQEKDFNKITKTHIIDIFRQVTLDMEHFKFIKENLKVDFLK